MRLVQAAPHACASHPRVEPYHDESNAPTGKEQRLDDPGRTTLRDSSTMVAASHHRIITIGAGPVGVFGSIYLMWPTFRALLICPGREEWLIAYPLSSRQSSPDYRCVVACWQSPDHGHGLHSLTKSVLKRHGAELGEESVIQGAVSSLVVLRRSLGWRLLWPCIGFALILFLLQHPFHCWLGALDSLAYHHT